MDIKSIALSICFIPYTVFVPKDENDNYEVFECGNPTVREGSGRWSIGLRTRLRPDRMEYWNDGVKNECMRARDNAVASR